MASTGNRALRCGPNARGPNSSQLALKKSRSRQAVDAAQSRIIETPLRGATPNERPALAPGGRTEHRGDNSRGHGCSKAAMPLVFSRGGSSIPGGMSRLFGAAGQDCCLQNAHSSHAKWAYLGSKRQPPGPAVVAQLVVVQCVAEKRFPLGSWSWHPACTVSWGRSRKDFAVSWKVFRWGGAPDLCIRWMPNPRPDPVPHSKGSSSDPQRSVGSMPRKRR